jgi:hypothetical protein
MVYTAYTAHMAYTVRTHEPGCTIRYLAARCYSAKNKLAAALFDAYSNIFGLYGQMILVRRHLSCSQDMPFLYLAYRAGRRCASDGGTPDPPHQPLPPPPTSPSRDQLKWGLSTLRLQLEVL